MLSRIAFAVLALTATMVGAPNALAQGEEAPTAVEAPSNPDHAGHAGHEMPVPPPPHGAVEGAGAAVDAHGAGHADGHGAGPGDGHGDGHGGGHGDGHGGGHGAHHDPSANFNWFKGIPFGYKSMDAKGGPLGDGKLGVGPDAPAVAPADEEHMNAPFILMFVNFGILLFILAKFAGPAARKMAETRSDTIKNALEESARLRKEAKSKLDEYKAKLEAADAEIDKMVTDMRASAEADKQRMLAAADKQAELLKKDAEARIAAEITRARDELTKEVTAAATAAAEKMLREKATGGDHQKLVDSFIADLMKAPAVSKEAR